MIEKSHSFFFWGGDHDFTINLPKRLIQVGTTHFIILSSPVIPSTHKLAAFGHHSLSQVFVSKLFDCFGKE
jgi:hypothetical protein